MTPEAAREDRAQRGRASARRGRLARRGCRRPRADAELLGRHRSRSTRTAGRPLAGSERGGWRSSDPPGAELLRALRPDRRRAVAPNPVAAHHRYRGVRPAAPARRARGLHSPARDRGHAGMGGRPTLYRRNPVIVDLCTGSGRAGASRWPADGPTARVIAVDDPTHGTGVRPAETCRLPASNWSWPTSPSRVCCPSSTARVDLLVANPPYIPDGVELEPEVAEHDPPHALFGGAGRHGGHRADRGARRPGGCSRGGLLAVEHDDTTSDADGRERSAAQDDSPTITGAPRSRRAAPVRDGPQAETQESA